MTLYMLDTNAVGHLVRGHPAVARRAMAVPMASLCISAVTQGELLFGLARRPAAKRLHRVVRELLRRVDSLPWGSGVAERYGSVRSSMERQGKILGPLDLLIASHALSAGAVLVTNDRSFGQVPDLGLEDWTTA